MSEKTVSVIGATGGVGREVVRLALDRGYAVRALARTPSNLGLEHARLEVRRGDARDVDALRDAARGAEIVLSCLGNRRGEAPVVAEGTRNLLEAMRAEGVERLALISSIGANESAGQLLRLGPAGWIFAVVFRTALRATKRDLEEAERIARASDRATVIVRPSGLSNRPGLGRWTTTDHRGRVAPSIPRADVAAFLVSLVEDPSHDRSAVSIGGP
jgi:uncharacterized protein YbjT (DUF2867 family)